MQVLSSGHQGRRSTLLRAGPVDAASSARVSVTETERGLLIEVSDDGVGGAEPARGGGLQGLEDRTAAIGGRISIKSPLGAGTRLVAEIPCG